MASRFVSLFEEYVFWACAFLLAVNAWVAISLVYPAVAQTLPHFFTPYFFYISVFLDPWMAIVLLCYGPWVAFTGLRRGVRSWFFFFRLALYGATFLLPFAWYAVGTNASL